MPKKIVPPATRLAAKRGFIRTTLQGYEAVLAVGISANIVLGLIRGEADVLTLAVTAAVAIVSPPLAGLRSWVNITHNGIPEDYIPAAIGQEGSRRA